MFPGNKLRIFTRQGHFTFEGDSTTIFWKPWEIRHQHVIAWGQYHHVVAAVVLVDADDIEQVQGKTHQIGVVVLLGNGLRQRL